MSTDYPVFSQKLGRVRRPAIPVQFFVFSGIKEALRHSGLAESCSQQCEEISEEGHVLVQHLHVASVAVRCSRCLLWPICSVTRRKPPAVKGPYLSPGGGGEHWEYRASRIY